MQPRQYNTPQPLPQLLLEYMHLWMDTQMENQKMTRQQARSKYVHLAGLITKGDPAGATMITMKVTTNSLPHHEHRHDCWHTIVLSFSPSCQDYGVDRIYDHEWAKAPHNMPPSFQCGVPQHAGSAACDYDVSPTPGTFLPSKSVWIFILFYLWAKHLYRMIRWWITINQEQSYNNNGNVGNEIETEMLLCNAWLDNNDDMVSTSLLLYHTCWLRWWDRTRGDK